MLKKLCLAVITVLGALLVACLTPGGIRGNYDEVNNKEEK